MNYTIELVYCKVIGYKIKEINQNIVHLTSSIFLCSYKQTIDINVEKPFFFKVINTSLTLKSAVFLSENYTVLHDLVSLLEMFSNTILQLTKVIKRQIIQNRSTETLRVTNCRILSNFLILPLDQNVVISTFQFIVNQIFIIDSLADDHQSVQLIYK